VKSLSILALVPVFLIGCAGTVKTTRTASIADRDFYTNEEIKGLTPEARNRYCRALDEEIVKLRGEASMLEASADSMGQVSDSLKAYNRQLATEIRDLDGEIRQLRLARRAATSYVVKKGDTLRKISSVVFGTSDRWQEIYEANKGRIESPDTHLREGVRLTIPSK